MPHITGYVSSWTKLSSIFFSILIAITTAAGVRAWLSTAAADPPHEQPASAPAPEAAHNQQPGNQQQSRRAPAEVEILTLRPTGFEPSRLNLSAGQFLLVVHNRSGLERVSLRLSHQSGDVVLEAQVPRNRPTWRRLVDLQPGRYNLSVAEQPEWVCRIMVNNR